MCWYNFKNKLKFKFFLFSDDLPICFKKVRQRSTESIKFATKKGEIRLKFLERCVKKSKNDPNSVLDKAAGKYRRDFTEG